MTLYVCSNCRDGTCYEAEEILVPEPQPHGELLHFRECPRCANRDSVFPLDADGLRTLRAMAKVRTPEFAHWAADTLYDIASEQVTV